MTNPRSFSCFIMGETTLPVHCGEILLRHGHEISGIISAESSLIQWAKEADIPVFPLGTDLIPLLRENPVDYLFSIANLAILSPEVLRLPRKLAINYHDGPLPRYAGLNVPSWAMLNHEETHGVTWHLMTESIDAGAILYQEQVKIDKDDTILILNMKCYEAAIRTFERLVDDLSQERLQPRTPGTAPESYFSANKRPAAACTLLWNQDAEDLSALVRALNFGAYVNPLGSPKVLINQDAVLVTELEIAATQSNRAPGTILRIRDDGLMVATASDDIVLRSFVSNVGLPLTIADVVAAYGLREGDLLPTLDPSRVEALTTFHESAAKYEKAWVKRLSSLQPIDIPYGKWESSQAASKPFATKRIVIPQEALERWREPSQRNDLLLATFAAYLARIQDRTSFDLSFSDPALRSGLEGFETIFAAQVPLRLNIEAEQSFDEVASSVRQQLQWVRKRLSYTRDIFVRYPELHSATDVLPVSVQQVKRLEDALVGSALTWVIAEDGRESQWLYDTRAIAEDDILNMQRQFMSFLHAVVSDSSRPIGDITLTSVEHWQLIQRWNETRQDYPRDLCLHELFEAQVRQTPEAVALVGKDCRLSYGELNARANQLTHHLKRAGVGPEVLVGIYTERVPEMLIGLLGILKAGGAYLPLDPTYPQERIGFMLEDAQVGVLLTQEHLIAQLPQHAAHMICLDSDWHEIAQQPSENPDSSASAENLAYVIYTSGSTGKPKGVMVTHRNVVNFIHAMDTSISHHPSGVWLAVTSISFDISVLELFWTLARGFKVVLYAGEDRRASESRAQHRASTQNVDFSLFYFASDESEGMADKYKLLIEGAKFGDAHGFSAVWTPERHFHAFGGLYPNPSVVSAALAAITQNIHIRAGSCVLPLHSPIRVAEEWSVVDNLSNGRVGLSFASGWQPNDFVLAPENFADRKDLMFRQIETVRQLWRGESVTVPGPTGQDVSVKILPHPVQPELPVWITAAGNPETFRMAGERGFGVLTHLLGQSVQELTEKIEIYRRAWRENGHAPGKERITLMVHTFVGSNDDHVREIVREPMKQYLRSSVGLIQQAAWSFPTFKQATTSEDGKFSLDQLSEDQLEAVLDFAFERYFETSGLFGTPETCRRMVERLADAGVNEIACLIDFGVASETVLAHLEDLNVVKSLAQTEEDGSIAALIRRHEVTHMQCTPSMAGMLLLDGESREALGSLQQLLIGGEAFPPALATKLRQVVKGEIRNMYGPTETTIWSSTYAVTDERMSIGRPISNTELYILNRNHQPVPIGVAGELFIGGDGVARGYLNRPELTCERFIPHPFSDKPDARLYQTGDLVRYFPDGSIEYMGRLDQQVKIRGFRIELGEIEAALGTHPAVEEAVVVAREDAAGDKRLVAYIVTAAQSSRSRDALSTADLRAHLKQTLPDYMLPSAFEVLDALPRTLNGKIDRSNLPEPGQARPALVCSFIAPRDELERQLAEIWEKELGVKPIGVSDNFFDLGGHSLLAVRVFTRAEQLLGKRLPLATFFQAPTIEQLAHVFRDKGWSAPWTALVPIQPTGSNPPFFCIHAHGGHVLFYHNLSRHLGADQPFYALQAQGLDGSQAPYRRFEDMAAHYLKEIRSVQPEGPYFLGGDCMGGVIAYEMAQQLQAQGQEVALLAMIDSLPPGYPKLLPHVSPALYSVAHTANKFVYHHLKNLRRLTFREQLAYIADKSDKARFTTSMKLNKLLRKFHLGREQAADPLVEVQDALQGALDSYEPKPYRGRLTLFRASKLPFGMEIDPQLGWGKFARDGVEVYEIPSYFTTAIFEPSVQIVAAHLKQSIDEKSRQPAPEDEIVPEKSA